MIIFTPMVDIPQEYLEYKDIKTVYKYNLTSYYSNGIITLNHLIPSVEYIPEDILSMDLSTSFDMEYTKYLIENDNAFCQLMSIMNIEYMQSDDTLIQILVDRSDYRDSIMESLMKVIQQRYGCITFYIDNLEDFVYAKPQDFTDISGMFTLDKDLARWRMIVLPMSGEDIYE